jgi:hypothetical protein
MIGIEEAQDMSTITSRDGSHCYNDWGLGQPIAFSHGASMGAILQVYDDAPNGLQSTLKGRLDRDVFDFVASVRK